MVLTILMKLSLLRSKYLSRSRTLAIAAGVAAAALLAGHAANLASSLTGIVSVARAQGSSPEYTSEQVINYAESILAIEAMRLEVHSEISNALGTDEIPEITCNNNSSLNGLSRKVRRMVVDYCTESIQIVERNGLTIAEFNSITASVGSNSRLRQRVREALQNLR